MLNQEVVIRTRPYDNGRLPSALRHVREAYTGATLCRHACLPEDGWDALEDRHPEDVDAIDRCTWCYEVIEDAKRREREAGCALV